MGVQGLLQLLKPAQRDCNLSQFRGQTAAVDVMTWLYKGAYSCAYELGLDQQTLGFLSYPLKMLKLVQTYGIKPICVFDGLHLKAKEATEKVRSHNKQVNKELAMAHAEDGKEDEARKYFMRSLVLRTKMIDLFMDIIKKIGIEVVIAPYEADSQIAYMVREGIADFAISEDSDLIVYGCPKLVMKLNFNGYCKVFSMQDFKTNQKLSTDASLKFLQSCTRAQFVQICIMGGCEYLPSIQQVGLKVAVKQFVKHNGDVDQVIAELEKSKTFKERVPKDYLSALKKVQQVFFFQTVYDPRQKKLTSLEPIPEGLDLDQEFMGAFIDEQLLDQFVNGQLKKSTMTKREEYEHVLDFKKLLNDYIDNAISERSFVCLDRKFFSNNFWQSDRQANQALNQEEESKQQEDSLVHKPRGLLPVKKPILVEDLGFCLDEGSDIDDDDFLLMNNVETYKENLDNNAQFSAKELNMDNKQVKEDLVELSQMITKKVVKYNEASLVKGLLMQTPIKHNANKFARNSSGSQMSSQTSANEQLKTNTSEVKKNPFKRFDELIPILEEQEKEKDEKKEYLISSYINKKPEISGKKVNQKKRKRAEISENTTATKSNIKQSKVNAKLDSFFEKKSGSKKLKMNA